MILPQAFKNVLPAMCNEFVAITKETSLASTFYVGDLMTQYQTISGKTYLVLEPLIIVGIIYFVITFAMSKLVALLEKKLKDTAFKEAFAEPVEEVADYTIIKEKKFELRPMDVEEAILQMNLIGHEFFVFKNMDADDAIAVVYKRRQGGYGLICDDGLDVD